MALFKLNKAKSMQSEDPYGGIPNAGLNDLRGLPPLQAELDERKNSFLLGATRSGANAVPNSLAQVSLSGAGYVSPHVKDFEDQFAGNALQNYKNTPSTFELNRPIYNEAAKNEASIRDLPFSASYNPKTYKASKFNFKGLPEQYGTEAYNLGSRDIRNEGNATLGAARQQFGLKRPGLFSKFALQQNYNTNKNLADLSSNINLEKMRQNVDLQRQQQIEQENANRSAAQLGETQSQFGANFGVTKFQNDLDRKRMLSDTLLNRAQIGGNQMYNDVQARNSALSFLNNLYAISSGQANQALANQFAEDSANDRAKKDRYGQLASSAIGAAGTLRGRG